MRLYTLLSLVLLLGCAVPDNKKQIPVVAMDTLPAGRTIPDTGRIIPDTGSYFHLLNKLSVTGDFDGDGRVDTVFQHAFPA